MAYTYLRNSTTADVVEVRDNFTHVASGSRLPMGGSMLSATTGVYDLGASSTVWNNIFCNNLEVSGSISSSRQLWVLLSEQVLSGTTASINFSLNGDAQQEYKLVFNIKCGTNYTIASSYPLLLSTQLSLGSDYSWQAIKCENASVGSYLGTSEFWFILNHTSIVQSIGTLLYFHGIANLSLKTGKPRMGTSRVFSYFSGTTTPIYQTSGLTLDDENTTISTIFLEAFRSYMLTGSTIQLWGMQ